MVTNHTASWATYNLFGLDAIGQIRRSGTTWNRFYFLPRKSRLAASQAPTCRGQAGQARLCSRTGVASPKDHLGSIKVIVNTSGNRIAHTDLYPFGFEMPGRVSCQGGPDCRYKFTGNPDINIPQARAVTGCAKSELHKSMPSKPGLKHKRNTPTVSGTADHTVCNPQFPGLKQSVIDHNNSSSSAEALC